MCSWSITALDAWDTTIYPHEQVLWDVEYLRLAIAALEAATPDEAAALAALQSIDLTWYGINFSHDVYAWDLTRHAPGFKGLYFAEQGRLAPYLDVMAEYNAIKDGSWGASTITSLGSMRDAELTELNSRLNKMSHALEQITPAIEALH